MNAAIRGACPGIVTPMATGDGLLARLVPHEPVPIAAFQTLCTAAAEYGNGIIEVTQRGSLQIRGLTEDSARDFAEIVGTLNIGAEGGPSLLTSPLFGIDAGGLINSNAIATRLRNALAEQAPGPNGAHSPAAPLSPKVSVLLDGGGKLHLDAVWADIRLRAMSESRFELALAGDAATATHMGYVATDEVVPTVMNILAAMASRGGRARANNREHGANAPATALGHHRLRNGTLATGIALPFGHTTAPALLRLTQAAAARGATSLRPAPGRVLLAVGFADDKTADEFGAIAQAEGFIVHATDPRRHVVACAGAPACASATLPTRQLAPEVASVAGRLAGTDKVIHLSGCSKGCAHPRKAAITIIGPDRWLLNGRASDAPQGTIPKAGLIAEIERLCAEIARL